MRLQPQDTRSPSGGGGSASAPASSNPRAGTEQTVLFSTTTELPVEKQTLLQAARERLGAQVKTRDDGHLLDKDLPCPIQDKDLPCPIFASKDRCITTSSAPSSSSVPYAHDLRYEYVNTLIRWDPHEYVKYVDTLGTPQRMQQPSFLQKPVRRKQGKA